MFVLLEDNYDSRGFPEGPDSGDGCPDSDGGTSGGGAAITTSTATASGNVSIDTGEDTVSVDGEPLVVKEELKSVVENLTADTARLKSAKQRAVSRLNESLAYYQDPVRVWDQQALIDDAIALRALTPFVETSENRTVEEVATAIGVADNESVRRVVHDAERAYDQYENRLGPGVTNSAQAHIRNADRILKRAEQIRERARESSGDRQLRTTARAVRKYGVALNQAQTALRLIGSQSDFTFPGYIQNATFSDLERLSSLEQRAWALSQMEDIVTSDQTAYRALTNAFEPVNDSVLAYVDWSRIERSEPFEADRTAVQKLQHVDGSGASDTVRRALVMSDRSLAATAISDAEFVLDEYGTEIETAEKRQQAETHIEDAQRALNRGDDRRSGDNGDTQSYLQAIKQYKQAWKDAQTAIETVDSEVGLSISVSTGQHKPGNETIIYPLSGEITAPSATVESVEIYVDGEHHKTVNVSTARAPGMPERFETELELATTEATVKVVASEGAGGEEVSETITLDAPGFGDEVYDVELTEPESGATITVTGEGIVKSDFVVDHVPADEERSFHAGSFIHVRNFTDFESATVEMPLNEDVDPSDGNLSVYKWDQHDEKPWHAVESDVNVENGTAVATVDSFSYFSVFWVDNWNDAVTDTVNLAKHPEYVANESGGSIEPVDLAFVIDESGSMSGTRIQDAKASAKRFVGGLYEDDRSALVSFSGGTWLRQSLTTDHGAVNASIDGLNAGGGTNTGAGLKKAIDELTTNGESDTQEIILLADGGTTEGSNPVDIARQADDEGITIHTVGMGTGIDAQELTSIADATGGEFYQVSDSSELPEVFDRIEQNRISLVDSDEDGIPNVVEDMHLSMIVGSPGMVGVPAGLDPDDPHTATETRVDGNVTEFEWVTYQENGDPMITAKMVDASVHPGSGESVRKEFIKIGFFLPTEADAESEDPVSELQLSYNQDESAYAIAADKDDTPSERMRHDWPIFASDPSWLPEDIVDSDKYHMKLDLTVVAQYTHDVKTEELPDSFEVAFSKSSMYVYDQTKEFEFNDDYTVEELIIAAPEPSGNVDLTKAAYSEMGRSEFTIDLTDTTVGREEIIRSEYPYAYDTNIAERYKKVYNNAMDIFQESMISAASFTTGSIPFGKTKAAATMTQKGLITVIDNSNKIFKVVDGREQTGYNDMQSDIYDEFDVQDDSVVVTTGPVLMVDLSDQDEGLED